MDTWARLFTDGDLVVKIVVLQTVVAVFVLFLLKKLLSRELFLCALEQIAHVPADQGAGIDEVVVVAAGRISGDEEFRLRTVIKERFPQADIIVGEDHALGGGLLVRAGGHVFDFSLWTKIRQLFKRSNA